MSCIAALLLAIAPLRVVVMPFAAQPVGMTDEVLPSASELGALRTALIEDLRRDGVTVIASRAHCSDDDARCYQRVASAHDARAVLTANVTRYMALLWSFDVGIRDVARNNARLLRSEYKGDFEALLQTMPQTAATVEKSLR